MFLDHNEFARISQEDARAHIFDVDGVLTDHSPAQDIEFGWGAVAAAMTLVKGLRASKARKLAGVSARKFESSGELFVRKYGERFGFDREYMHRERHRHTDSSSIVRSEKLVELFDLLLQQGKEIGIYTHSHFDWTDRVLTQRGLRKFVRDDHIFSLEKCNYIKKSDSYQFFEAILQHMGVAAEEAIMHEDTERNLVHPWQNKWAATVLVKNGRTFPPEKIPHVSYVAENIIDVLEVACGIHPNPAKEFHGPGMSNGLVFT